MCSLFGGTFYLEHQASAPRGFGASGTNVVKSWSVCGENTKGNTNSQFLLSLSSKALEDAEVLPITFVF
jgi:hypothetical protein